MARAALPGRLTWQRGPRVGVGDDRDETPRPHDSAPRVPDWPGHLPGQHLDVRLTAEDGYRAQRSYSIASPPEARPSRITVERLEDGEVSPYLTDELRPGDQLELRGPIGGYFTGTRPTAARSAGRGRLGHRAADGDGPAPDAASSNVPMRLLCSSRTLDDVIYRTELEQLAAGDGFELPGADRSRAARLDRPPRPGRRALLDDVAWPAGTGSWPTSAGRPASSNRGRQAGPARPPAARIKTERFGGTGAP